MVKKLGGFTGEKENWSERELKKKKRATSDGEDEGESRGRQKKKRPKEKEANKETDIKTISERKTKKSEEEKQCR